MSNYLERHQASGLTPPICIYAGWKAWALVLLGAPALIGGSVLAMLYGGEIEQAAGAIGAPFFAVCFGVLGVALGRSRKQGLVRLGPEGLYLAHLNITFAWIDIDHAYMIETRHSGGVTRQVMFELRNGPAYRAKADWLGRQLFTVAQKTRRQADTLSLNIPSPFISAQDGEDIVGIINHEAAQAQEMAGAAQ